MLATHTAIEEVIHVVSKETYFSLGYYRKKEFETHLTYMEEMEVLIDIGFSQPKHVARKSKRIDGLREY